MAKLRMAHASTHGARKPPGPILTGKEIDPGLFFVQSPIYLHQQPNFYPQQPQPNIFLQQQQPIRFPIQQQSNLSSNSSSCQTSSPNCSCQTTAAAKPLPKISAAKLLSATAAATVKPFPSAVVSSLPYSFTDSSSNCLPLNIRSSSG